MSGQRAGGPMEDEIGIRAETRQAGGPNADPGTGREVSIAESSRTAPFNRFDLDDYYADAFGSVLDDCMGLCCR